MLNISDSDWAVQQLIRFIELANPVDRPHVAAPVHAGSRDELIAQLVVIEPILDRSVPDWRLAKEMSMNGNLRFWGERQHAVRAKAVIENDRLIREKLGEDSPKVSASSMHPWAWDGAKSLWQSRHYREAVTAAARKVNAETQNKVARRDVSETALFQSVFSKDPAKPGQPRLRILPDDGSDTFRSVQRGAAAFAEGCYAGIRNPNSHEDGLPELPEHEALEQLAAFSQLARWVDGAAVEKAP